MSGYGDKEKRKKKKIWQRFVLVET